jgi:hypothetical protein
MRFGEAMIAVLTRSARIARSFGKKHVSAITRNHVHDRSLLPLSGDVVAHRVIHFAAGSDAARPDRDCRSGTLSIETFRLGATGCGAVRKAPRNLRGQPWRIRRP